MSFNKISFFLNPIKLSNFSVEGFLDNKIIDFHKYAKENGDITLGSALSEQSEKMPKKIVGGRKSATGDARKANRTEGGKKVSVKKAVSQELYKDL